MLYHGYYNMAFGLSPTGMVYIGQEQSVLQWNAGTWSTVMSSPQVHADQYVLIFNQDGSKMYDGNDGGIWMYQPGQGGAQGTITNMNTSGLQDNQVYYVAQSPSNPNILLIGSQDNGTARTADGGQTWLTLGRCDGTQVHFAPSNQIGRAQCRERE